MNISLARTNALVMALCKLHNFSIDENVVGISKPTLDDSVDIALHGGLDLSAFRTSREDVEFNIIRISSVHCVSCHDLIDP